MISLPLSVLILLSIFSIIGVFLLFMHAYCWVNQEKIIKQEKEKIKKLIDIDEIEKLISNLESEKKEEILSKMCESMHDQDVIEILLQSISSYNKGDLIWQNAKRDENIMNELLYELNKLENFGFSNKQPLKVIGRSF